MTDRAPEIVPRAAAAQPTRRTVTGRPRPLPTALATVACFLVLFEFLAFRLSTGQDPALGTPSVTAATQPRPAVIHRRVVNTKVVSLPPKAAAASAPVSSAPAPGSSGTVGATPAPAPAPAAAPAPAPAPAPATPVTSTS